MNASTTSSRPLKVGVQLPEIEREVRWPELLDMIRAIEDLGFDSIWVGEHLRDRTESECGDRPVRPVGGRHAETRRQADHPTFGQRPPDDEQADRANRRGDGEPEDEATERECGIHWCSLS